MKTIKKLDISFWEQYKTDLKHAFLPHKSHCHKDHSVQHPDVIQMAILKENIKHTRTLAEQMKHNN